MAEDVYCTLVMSDSYLPGAAVLAHSLRDSGTTKKLAVLTTPDTLLHSTILELRKLYDYVISVERIANPNLENLARLDRLDLRFTFTKIALWRQERFRKIVYIDADVVALRAPDELFDIDAPLAAAPDIGWPDIFNSGVMMLKPSMGEYWSLHTLASSGISFDGADQGLLNEHFGNRPWKRISFTYNCTPNASYQYEPAYRHFRSSINMVHFIGKDKPWNQGRGPITSSGSAVYRELYGKWWAVYDRHYFVPQASAPGQFSAASATVARYVNDEQSQLAAVGWASAGMPALHSAALGAAIASIEQPMHDTRDVSESPGPPPPPPGPTPEPAHQVATRPPYLPQEPQRPFSPPKTPWDATRDAPPNRSTPEAANFPVSQYEMSSDTRLFQPPEQYPEPPRDMYYKIPEIRPAVTEPPKPIFPWEISPERPKPTRVFEDTPPAASPLPPEKIVPSVPSTPKMKEAGVEWSDLMRGNAWDNISSIDQYVRAMKEATARRGQVQVVHQESPSETAAVLDEVTSPTETRGSRRQQRRESLILTDFPTEIERPSLPVTPAPIRRPTFWGEERDKVGDLPPAQGVPEQTAWNPLERLEQLRRASLLAAEELPQSIPDKDLPIRDMPETSIEATSPTDNPAASEADQNVAITGSEAEVLKSFGFSTSASTTSSVTVGVPTTAATELEKGDLPPESRPGGDEYSIA